MQTASETLFRHLAARGVQHMFVVPGDDPYMLAAIDKCCTPVVMRDERAAAFAAQVYGRLTGLGACMTSHGPGMSNLVTGLAAAYLEHDPVIAVCSQLPREHCNRYSHAYVSEAILEPVTKRTFVAADPGSLVREAAALLNCSTAPPLGPVALVLPQDISGQAVTPTESSAEGEALVSERDSTSRDEALLKGAVDRIDRCKHLIVLIGAGVIRHNGVSEIREFVSRMSAIPLTTLHAKGVIGAPREFTVSRHGLESIMNHIDSDLCVVFGLDESEGLDDLLCDRDVIWVEEATPDRRPEAGRIYADLKSTLTYLNRTCQPKESWTPNSRPGRDAVHIVERVAASSSGFSGLLCVDTGLYKHACAAYGAADVPRKYIFTNGLSSIGWSLAASIGAHFATGASVLAVIGDGGFSMAASELFPILQYNLPISILVIRDDAYGMIRRLEFERTGSASSTTTIQSCDFGALAACFGFEYVRVDDGNLNACFTFDSRRRRLFELQVDYSGYEFVHR